MPGSGGYFFNFRHLAPESVMKLLKEIRLAETLIVNYVSKKCSSFR